MTLGLVLALCSGKRVSFPYFSFLIATVVLFHLFLPLGKVWFHVGSWPFTEGAFLLGLGKGFTFAGLVFLSLGAIHRRLELPGTLGQVWAQTFSWYEQLMEQRAAIKPRALLLSLDRLLERLYPTKSGSAIVPQISTPLPSDGQKAWASRTTAAGWVLVAVTTGAALLVAVFIP